MILAISVIVSTKAVPLKEYADSIAGQEPLIKYFLDGSRHVFKVDDIAYNKHIYPVVAGKLIAWMWVGISRFEKQIPKINQMRGVRLRSANIQIGGDDALQELFKENRGNYYYVGEVFAVDDRLIPNSQRDYFNENEIG